MKAPELASRGLESVRSNIEKQGMRRGLAHTISDGLTAVRRRYYHELNARRGTNIYERDWDVLVLLDCARVDMMKAAAKDFDFLGRVGTHRSPGTSSVEWMRTTFTDEYIDQTRETVYVTANPNSANQLDSSRFARLEEVWCDAWDERVGTVPANAVTARAVALHRKLRPRRMIIHYMQPHPPFVGQPDLDAAEMTRPGVETEGMDVKALHFEAGYSSEALWEAHMKNLEYVLDDVELLISNIDADRLILSADHGQALGEEGVWGHPRSMNLDVLRDVPWCAVSAEDTGEYEPDFEIDRRNSEESNSVAKKLEHLGYR